MDTDSAYRQGGDSLTLAPPGVNTRKTEKAKDALGVQFVLDTLVKQWFLITLGVFILLAYLFPKVGSPLGAIRAEYTIAWGAVAVIFLIAGLSLSLVASRTRPGPPPSSISSPALAGRQAGLDFEAMAGMVVAGVLPTTVASNVTATRLAGGNTELASIQVVIGNVIGVFLSPALLDLFLSDALGWSDAKPNSNGNDIRAIYIQMGKQLSATLIAPLIVGLTIQHIFPRFINKYHRRLRLDKVASFMLILCVWSNFCKAFEAHTFKTTSHLTVVYLCLVQIGLYVLYTAVILFMARLPGIQSHRIFGLVGKWRFTKRDTIAACFCGPAKGAGLGTSLITIFYAKASLSTQAKMALALVLYQGEQVACAQLFVPLLARWAKDEQGLPSTDSGILPEMALQLDPQVRNPETAEKQEK